MRLLNDPGPGAGRAPTRGPSDGRPDHHLRRPKAGMLAWLARTGDALLDARFDDFLLNCERRMYYGFAVDEPASPLRSDALRIPEMETVDAAFALASGTVAQRPASSS